MHTGSLAVCAIVAASVPVMLRRTPAWRLADRRRLSRLSVARPPLVYARLGPARPTALVALFHGLGGGLDELRPMAERWLDALPDVGFLLLQAPDRDYYARELKSGAFSGDWFRYPQLRSAFTNDDEGLRQYNSMAVEFISARVDHVSSELDTHLTACGVDNRRLILAGFSQGAAICTYTGLRRGCLGVLPLGGPCPPRPELLPDNDVTAVRGRGRCGHCVAHELTPNLKIPVRYATDGPRAAQPCARAVEGVRRRPGVHPLPCREATPGCDNC